LVIGIDAYLHVRPLKGAVADALDIENALRRTGVQDVTALIDAMADRSSILSAINHLVARTGPRDLVVLSLAGHGAQEPERVRGSQPDGVENVFLLPGFENTAAGSQERVLGAEFNHFIKQFEARGAHVLFIADTCFGGGMTRDIDPRAEEMSFRQVPSYRLSADLLKPVTTASDALLTELDFDRTVFLAAVDRKTKAPEVQIPGIAGLRDIKGIFQQCSPSCVPAVQSTPKYRRDRVPKPRPADRCRLPIVPLGEHSAAIGAR
jgi:hypothetical protein